MENNLHEGSINSKDFRYVYLTTFNCKEDLMRKNLQNDLAKFVFWNNLVHAFVKLVNQNFRGLTEVEMKNIAFNYFSLSDSSKKVFRWKSLFTFSTVVVVVISLSLAYFVRHLWTKINFNSESFVLRGCWLKWGQIWAVPNCRLRYSGPLQYSVIFRWVTFNLDPSRNELSKQRAGVINLSVCFYLLFIILRG